MSNLIEDPRLTARIDRGLEICRVTTTVAGKEFICLLPVHDDGKKADQNDSRGRPARWRKHHFVRRYPYSDH